MSQGLGRAGWRLALAGALVGALAVAGCAAPPVEPAPPAAAVPVVTPPAEVVEAAPAPAAVPVPAPAPAVAEARPAPPSRPAEPPPAEQAAPRLGLLTILDGGEGTLLRGATRLALAEGVALRQGDIVETGARTRLLRLEFDDGASLALGAETRVQLAPSLPGERGRAAPRAYLLSGWAKLTADKAPLALATRWFDLAGVGKVAVVRVQADGAQVFVESGEARLQMPATPPLALKAGGLVGVDKAAPTKPVLSPTPTPAFVQAVPRAFLDTLPARAATFKGKDPQPRRLGEPSYAELQPWLDAEPALRRANLARWRPLAADADFRKPLRAALPAHPEWAAVLAPLPKP